MRREGADLEAPIRQRADPLELLDAAQSDDVPRVDKTLLLHEHERGPARHRVAVLTVLLQEVESFSGAWRGMEFILPHLRLPRRGQVARPGPIERPPCLLLAPGPVCRPLRPL